MDQKLGLDQKQKFHANARVAVPLTSVPLFKTHLAAQNGVDKNLLFATWGGIGDVICSEPTIRYAIEKFKDCKIAIATRQPEIFAHLELADVYDLKKEKPIEDDFLILHTIPNQETSNMLPQFLSHMISNCVDFPAISALRGQLPIANRAVNLRPKPPTDRALLELVSNKERFVMVHAGRHWQSKTFPVAWWNAVLTSIKAQGLTPVLIGKDEGQSQGYVALAATGCVDLRDKTSLNDSIWLLQNMPVLVCNDSSPLHMAVTGNAWILFVASVKHPDFIMHWRRVPGRSDLQWAWRMQNLSVGGLWEHYSICPNLIEDLNLDVVDKKLVEALLPDPEIFGPLCREKINEYLGKI